MPNNGNAFYVFQAVPTNSYELIQLTEHEHVVEEL